MFIIYRSEKLFLVIKRYKDLVKKELHFIPNLKHNRIFYHHNTHTFKHGIFAQILEIHLPLTYFCILYTKN